MEPLISARDLKKNFGKVEALKGVSLDVAEGEKVVVIGPSGSGKSTFLRCLNLLSSRRPVPSPLPARRSPTRR